MSSEEIKKLVLPAKENGGLNQWLPEEFGFITRDSSRSVFLKGKYELRRRDYNNWLLRKYDKNKKTGNTEIKVKWYVVIEPSEIEFAEMMFTLGLR
tara:strand:+ start:112 stop:399 length:288 start_codon:yes stop_codon:yes gene_type:complete